MQKPLFSVLLTLGLTVIYSDSHADDQLWERLKTEPNLIVLMRHANARGGNPLTWDESGNCEGESTLTGKGEELAHKIGDAFAAHNIKPTVISSPMCRCLETAEIAFGTKPITDPELRETASADEERQHKFETISRTLITSKRGSVPVVFISHRPNIDMLTMELIKEGDLLVGQISDSGEIEIQGKISIEP
jgi:phosphohistidine phosphatase SixA